MTTDRAGPEGTIERGERRLVARQTLFGFYAAMTKDIPLPWSPPLSAIQSIIDRVNAPAKPVGCLTRPPDSR